VLPTHEVLDQLAVRLEQAYALRRPRWWRGCSTTRVWHAAALRLWEAHVDDPARMPLDPELFVASQPISVPFADPWTELAHPGSARRYRSAVRRIIRVLRSELKREVLKAERLIGKGFAIEDVVGRNQRRLSPLARYIVAQRAGRDDLADRHAAAAANQHRSCPLYRIAVLALLPAESYPEGSLCVDAEANAPRRVAASEFSAHRLYRECEN
jgi:hypothetical protein